MNNISRATVESTVIKKVCMQMFNFLMTVIAMPMDFLTIVSNVLCYSSGGLILRKIAVG